jgi:hypothetical protein
MFLSNIFAHVIKQLTTIDSQLPLSPSSSNHIQEHSMDIGESCHSFAETRKSRGLEKHSRDRESYSLHPTGRKELLQSSDIPDNGREAHEYRPSRFPAGVMGVCHGSGAKLHQWRRKGNTIGTAQR